GAIPPIYPEYLGASAFQEKFRVRFNYVSGSMAKGIASEDLVIEVARHGGLGFFGSAGLSVSRIADAIDKIKYYLGDEYSFGVNLIHHLKDQQLEFDQVALFLEKGVRNIEASAFTSITPAAIWFAFKGIYLDDDGQIVRPNHVFAKISHEHVAESFLSPPDDYFLESLVALGHLSQYEASLAKNLPVAECVIVESDSGGHTDNRPSTALFPVIKLLTARLAAKFGYDETPFVGLAGGLGTPEAISAAFDIGADFCVIGSVHQSCVEAGTSDEVKKMLETAGLADYAMTPSPDMFEEGIKVQVLKKGTMMPIFGNRLFELYRQYQSLEELPDQVKQELETKIFKKTIAEVWEETMTYFISQDPSQLVQADVDPRHKMALVMRWYLGKSNQWSINGESSKRTDYQIWSGPALGAFNNWASGTFLEKVENREVGQVMLNLLEGAAHHKRIQQIKSFGITNVNQQKYVPKRLVPS
ncbi:MAG: PfaD family polyunsaturated fatty acid/polyketide biosynthesis protein, partial [Bacteroidota bacterium]